ncbi:molybdenum cofactor sulfurase (plasmid) [Burkholderia sp. PAMC 26561]|nr:MOSC domain-containing protein [Burkholderia sp. PAMC 26561]AME28300.1 molybdenum cofactor sulfurase [Burkholderia sp. PAMC 26561]
MPLNPQSSLTRLFNAPIRSGALIWIGVRPERRLVMRPVDETMLDPHVGLESDHYSRDSGKRQVTLIQAESLAAIASHLGLETLAPEVLRRNLVTRGINLLALKDRKFGIGDAMLEMTGECHPCSRLEETLGVGGYHATRGFGGITAKVLTRGRIGVGEAIARIDE